MNVDRSFVELNRAATERMRRMAKRLTDEQLEHPVGQHWTVALVFAHLAFLDRRAHYVLDATEGAGEVTDPDWNIAVNDIVLPLLAAIPPRRAVQLAIETAAAIDKRLESYPPKFLELVRAYRRRYVFRADHRNEHLDEAEQAMEAGGKP